MRIKWSENGETSSVSLSLSLSRLAVVDQHTRPQVHAKLHGLVLLVALGIEWFYDVDDWSYCQRPLRREMGGFLSGFSFP